MSGLPYWAAIIRQVVGNAIVRFLAWKMPYHTEHHTLAQVPFHKLPMLHAQMRDHLGVTANGYAEFTARYASHLR
ncbi:MAG: fatty acid desaturase [Roseovarius sp.]|nr:fatty acid desaturase [Roseovarius sp.]